MDQTAVKALDKVGISVTILGVVILVAGAFYVYRNYFEMEKLDLEIKKLKRDLAIA